MVKKNILNCLLVLGLIFLISGCRSSKKEEVKPDRFEKWRALAEESAGHTPDPRIYETVPDDKIKVGDREIYQEQLPQQIQEPEKKLPDLPISMKMHDVPVAVLLRTLARVADMNIMISENVTGQAKINISNIPWSQAFTGLLTTYSLSYKWSGDILRVICVEDLNREIALMEATQKFQKSKKEHAIAMMAIEQEKGKLEPLVTRIVKIDFTDLSALRTNLETYLSANTRDVEISRGENAFEGIQDTKSTGFRGSILMDENTNSLILHATRSDIKKIMPIIVSLDRPSKQILIEAHIVEANSDTAKELGVQWGGLGTSTRSGGKSYSIGGNMQEFNRAMTDEDGNPIPYDPTDGYISNFPIDATTGLSLGLMTQKIGEYVLYAQLSALQEEGKLNILSKPSITTMDHRKATIESGREIPFQSVEDDEVKIEWKKAVILLEVTPHVVNDNVIRLEILTHKDEFDTTNPVLGNPTIITKHAQTMVNLFDGQTTVIGGLNKEYIQEGESGVPWLKDVPGLGWLFKSISDSSDMEELLIFITPHILKGRHPGLNKAKG
ncbi:MAG: type IV pilus secretin PilQ [Desulfobacteraceae bacterium]|nr:type IV pilus secretin PilQ [Desulfobacteraceae bacterium]